MFLLCSCTKEETYAKRNLPETASNVQEYSRDTGFSGDYLRLLKADIPQKDFSEYVVALGMTEVYLEDKHLGIIKNQMRYSNLPDWWDNTIPEEDNAYILYDTKKEIFKLLFWKDSKVYYVSSGW